MGDSRYSMKYEKHSRSRSRSPFRKNFNERPMERMAKRVRRDSRDKAKRNRVFVNNIPFECRWMELKDLFREKVGDVTYVELFDDKGKFNGTGVVEFKDDETAQKAINVMHKFDYRGRLLNVKEDAEPDKGRPRPSPMGRGMERDRMGDRGMGFGGSNVRGGGAGGDFRSDPSFNTYGLNPEFLKSLGIAGPLTTKIFISNLDYKVTEKKLEEIFKLAGKLLKMELNLDAEGKSKGHAIGEYEHPLEAVQAISMFSGQKLYARNLNVRMDRFADDEPSSKLPSGLYGIGKGLGVNGQPMAFNNRNQGGTGVSNGSVGNFGLGIGGSMGNAVSGSGMGLGASNLGMVSNPSMGMSSGSSLGLSNSMAGDRSMMNASSLGMGMVGSNIGSSSLASSMGMMGSSSGMMSSVMSSSMDTGSRNNSFQLSPAAPSRNFRDNFDRNHDAFSSSSLSDTVLLGNLPSSFTWQMLKDRFRDIGDVRYAEMKGQGTAMIRFNSSQDAQRAISLMNGTRFDGRPIEVRFY